MKEIWKARKDNTRPWINYEFRTCTASLTGWNDIVRLSVLINWNETKNRNLSTRWSQAFGGGRRFRISGWLIDWDDSVFLNVQREQVNAVREATDLFFQEAGGLVISSKNLRHTWDMALLSHHKEAVSKGISVYTRERKRERKEGGRVRFFLFPLG